MYRRPTLIIEGQGDRDSVPLLLRRIYEANEIFDATPGTRPKICGGLGKLLGADQFERYVTYAARDDGDCVVVAVDCDDGDIIEHTKSLMARAEALRLGKPTEVVLFQREYESMFLHVIDTIAEAYPEYEWNLPDPRWADPEAIRDAKGALTSVMGAGRAYKPTRDQVKFTAASPLQALRSCSRSFARLEAAVLRLAHRE